MKKVIFVLFFISLYTWSFAQSEKFNDKKMLFGISCSADLPLSSFDEVDQSRKIVSGAGFSMSFISEFLLMNNLSISPKLGFSFNEESLKLDNEEIYRILPITADFALHLIIKSGKKKFSPYLVVGPSLNKPIGSKGNEWSDKYNFGIDIGIGTEVFFKHFIMAPELKYSYGLVDVNSNSQFGSIKHHKISLLFNFKG